jgi:hypothetical protein
MFNLFKRKPVPVRQRGSPQREYQKQLAELAENSQFGVCMRLSDEDKTMAPKENDDVAGFVVTAIANWIFLFGDYGPKVAGDHALKARVDAALPRCASALGNEDDIAEITLGVIIAAAAQNIPMPIFRSHFDKLAALGIVKKNINLNVPVDNRPMHLDEFLLGPHKDYYHYVQYGAALGGGG